MEKEKTGFCPKMGRKEVGGRGHRSFLTFLLTHHWDEIRKWVQQGGDITNVIVWIL